MDVGTDNRRAGMVAQSEALGCLQRLETFKAGALTAIRYRGTYLVLSYDQVIGEVLDEESQSATISTKKWSGTTTRHQATLARAWAAIFPEPRFTDQALSGV